MIPIAIGVLILAMASLFVSQTNNFTNKSAVKTEVKSIITVSPGPTEISGESPSPSPSSTPNASMTPSPSLKVSSLPDNSFTLQYPNSIKLDSNNFESTDDPDTITDWYKEKIKEMNMNVKNFVSTKTNGNVLNKLEGANGQSTIKVEIKKSADSSTVKINIEL